MTRKPRPFDFIAEVTALEQARRGDFTALADKVRLGRDLTTPERAFIADYLTGVAKLDLRAAQRDETRSEHLAIAALVLDLEAAGWPNTAAVVEVSRSLEISERTVRNAMKTHVTSSGAAFREQIALKLARRDQVQG